MKSLEEDYSQTLIETPQTSAFHLLSLSFTLSLFYSVSLLIPIFIGRFRLGWPLTWLHNYWRLLTFLSPRFVARCD